MPTQHVQYVLLFLVLPNKFHPVSNLMELHTLTQAARSYALLNCIIRTEPTFQIWYARGVSRTSSRPWILWCRWLRPASAKCAGSHKLCSSVCVIGKVSNTHCISQIHFSTLPPSLPHTWHLCTPETHPHSLTLYSCTHSSHMHPSTCSFPSHFTQAHSPYPSDPSHSTLMHSSYSPSPPPTSHYTPSLSHPP